MFRFILMIGGREMTRCNSCKVNVYSQHRECPLCGKLLSVPMQSETSYPQYEKSYDKDGFTVKRLFLYITIVACALSVFINAFTLDQALTFWSAIVIVSSISLWLIIYTYYKKSYSAGKKMLYIYAIISALLVALDIYSGFYKWSTTYVLPFLTVAVAFIFTAMAVENKNNYKEYLGFLIVIFFVSFVPIIIFVFSFTTQAWTSFVAILYCLLAIIGLFIFSGSKFKQELKKRFHLGGVH